MKKLLSACIPLLLTCASQASAQFVTGEELLEYCNSEDESQKAMCLGVIMGVRDTINTAQEWGSVRKTICIPQTMSASHLSKFVIKRFESQPESLRMNAAGETWKFMFADFPCK